MMREIVAPQQSLTGQRRHLRIGVLIGCVVFSATAACSAPSAESRIAQRPALLDSILARLRARSARIDEVSVLEVRNSSMYLSRRIVLVRGFPHDHEFKGNNADELFGLFVANDSLTRLIRTVDLIPTERWFDYNVRVDQITPDSIVLMGKGDMYGDAAMVRRYAW